jgi:hypothetical protein
VARPDDRYGELMGILAIVVSLTVFASHVSPAMIRTTRIGDSSPLQPLWAGVEDAKLLE